MYDDSYVPGFEDSEAVSAHGEGGGGGVGMTPLSSPLPPVQDFEKRLDRGAGRVSKGASLGKWGYGLSWPGLPGTRVCAEGQCREKARAGGPKAQDIRGRGRKH